MIASTEMQTFSTVVTAVGSPQAKDVSHIEPRCPYELLCGHYESHRQQEQIDIQNVTSNYGTLK